MDCIIGRERMDLIKRILGYLTLVLCTPFIALGFLWSMVEGSFTQGTYIAQEIRDWLAEGFE